MIAHNSLRSLLTVYSLSELYLCGSGFHPVWKVLSRSGLALVAPPADDRVDVVEEVAGCECEGFVVRYNGRWPCNGPYPWTYDAEVRPGQYPEGPAGRSLSLLKRSYAACRAWAASVASFAVLARALVDVWRLKPAGELEPEGDGSVRRS